MGTTGRELRFYPSVTEHPRRLTQEQLTDFNRVGYIKGIPIFNETEIGEHRRYFDALLANVIEEGGSNYSIISAGETRHALLSINLAETEGPQLDMLFSSYFTKYLINSLFQINICLR